MLNTILWVAVVALFAVIIIYRFFYSFKKLFTGNNPLNRNPKQIGLILIGLLMFGFGGYFVLFGVDTFTSNIFGAERPFYKNPDYWHDYTHYRNDQVTKIYDRGDKEAIYGDWKKVERVGFDVEETLEGYRIINSNYSEIWQNDSILSVDILKEGKKLNAAYKFNEAGKLIEISTSWGKTHKYQYDKKGKITEYSRFDDGNLASRSVFRYINQYDHVISIYDAEGNLSNEIEYTYDLSGLPKSIETREEHRKETLLGGEMTVFDATEKSIFTYQGARLNEIIEYNNGATRTKIYGPGLGIISNTPSRKTGKNSEIYTSKYTYDEHGNWLTRIYFKNSQAYYIAIREITYSNGEITGSTNSEIIKTLK